jgi:alpha-beta hydrolase superfamily lysophospholipase
MSGSTRRSADVGQDQSFDAVRIASDGAELVANVFGSLPVRRCALLCHGANWDASGWNDIAPLLVTRGLAAVALNFRGYGGSSGRTGKDSATTDIRNATRWLRDRDAREIALVGASMGGRAVLAASAEVDPECVVAISAPVREIADAEASRIRGRKLFICAEHDSLGAARAVRRAFEAAAEPKTLRLFPGREHSRAIFRGKHGAEALEALVDFVAAGL